MSDLSKMDPAEIHYFNRYGLNGMKSSADTNRL